MGVCVGVYVHVFLGAVCAPEAQKDLSLTLQIHAPCTAPTTASSVVTQKVMTWMYKSPVFCIF